MLAWWGCSRFNGGRLKGVEVWCKACCAGFEVVSYCAVFGLSSVVVASTSFRATSLMDLLSLEIS